MTKPNQSKIVVTPQQYEHIQKIIARIKRIKSMVK